MCEADQRMGALGRGQALEVCGSGGRKADLDGLQRTMESSCLRASAHDDVGEIEPSSARPAEHDAGRLKDAIPQYERVVADRERLLPAGHRDTLAARAILGAAYQQGRRLREAITTYERVVADSELALGPGDVDTLTSRCNLATAYYEAGRMADGVRVLRRALADCERHLGAGHPMTNTVRNNLQAAME